VLPENLDPQPAYIACALRSDDTLGDWSWEAPDSLLLSPDGGVSVIDPEQHPFETGDSLWRPRQEPIEMEERVELIAQYTQYSVNPSEANGYLQVAWGLRNLLGTGGLDRDSLSLSPDPTRTNLWTIQLGPNWVPRVNAALADAAAEP
jgi:hypothetical protein